MSVPAGWFPDPADAARHRWWDGSAWTRWLSSGPDAPDPTTPRPVPPPTPPDAALVANPADPADPGAIRAPWAVVLVVAVVVAGLIAVGTTVALTTDRIRTGPAVAPPTTAPEPALLYEPAMRALTLEELRVVMPAAPYECPDGPLEIAPFSSVLSCDAVIHSDYDGTQDWYATAGVGLLPESLVVPGDLKRTGDRAFLALRKRFFTRQVTKLQKFVAQPTDVAAPGKAMVLTGEVHYRVEGLSSRYDKMLVAVVQLRSGRHAAFYSVRPDDMPRSALAVLDASVSTFSAR